MRPAALALLRGRRGRMASELSALVRQPSVSATGEGVGECARLVAGAMRRHGLRARLLRLPGAPPLVYGEAGPARSGRSVLFYNHYDVQPPGPRSEWSRDPFSGEVSGGRVHGRGASDDKGELVARLAAVSAMADSGGLPCRVKFAVEGEEETGSASVGRYLRRHRRLLSCDGVVWEFGYVGRSGRPVVSLGMKGMLYAELSARGPRRDAHSSLAAVLESPAWRLVGALSALRGPGGRVAVRGWHAGVRPPGRAERRLLAAEPLDERALAAEHGVPRLLLSGAAARRAMAAGPTCNISGLSSGHAGPGAKTVLPASATAKVDLRLVPGMDPRAQKARLRAHLRRRGYGDVRVRFYHAVAASRTDPAHPFAALVRRSAEAAFGGCDTSLSSAGTGPMHEFASVLRAPCVSVGCTSVSARIHGPDEYADLSLMSKAAACMCGVIEGRGRAVSGGRAAAS